MDALEYEKARIRMCRTMILGKDGCAACPLYDGLRHPVKTRQSEFLKQFPSWIWTATPWFCGYKDSDTGCGAAMVRAADIGGWFGTVGACLNGSVAPACIFNPKSLNLREGMAYVEEVSE